MRYSSLLLLGAACLSACSSAEPARKTPPAKTTPAKTAPAKTAPAKTAPAKTAPAKAAPTEAKARARKPRSKDPAPPPAKPKEIRINVVVEGVDLADVMEAIGERVGHNVLVDPDVVELVTASYKDLPWREVVDRIAKDTGCVVEVRAGGILLLTQPVLVTLKASKAPLGLVIDRVARTADVEVRVPPSVRAHPVTLDVKDAPWWEVIREQLEQLTPPLTLAPGDDETYVILSPAEKRKLEQRRKREEEREHAKAGKQINVDVEGQDLAEVLEQISASVGQTVRVAPGVKETLSVSLLGIPWREAVEVIARMCACEVEEDAQGGLTLTQPPVVGIVARGAPAGVLLRLFASYDKTLTVSTTGLEGRRVSYDAASTRWLRTIREVAQRAGAVVTQGSKGQVVIKGGGAASPAGDAALAVPSTAPTADKPAEVAARKAALEAEVAEVFGRVEAHAKARKAEELIGALGELRELMELEGPDAVQAVQRGLTQREERFAGFRDVGLSLQLQIDLQVGNALLREFARAHAAERYDEAPALMERLREFKDRLFAQDRDVFHRTAEAIYLRGYVLAERMTKLKATVGYATDVSASVVLPKGSTERSSAIVDGRVYRPGETLRDAKGAPIAGLVLEEVGGGHVAFSYKGTWFSRAVGGAPERVPLPSGEGVVILNSGAVFVGTPQPSPDKTVTHAWSHGTQTWSQGERPQQIRWSNAREDRPNKDYWTDFGDLARFPIDERYVPLKKDYEEEKRLREGFVDVPKPEKKKSE